MSSIVKAHYKTERYKRALHEIGCLVCLNQGRFSQVYMLASRPGESSKHLNKVPLCKIHSVSGVPGVSLFNRAVAVRTAEYRAAFEANFGSLVDLAAQACALVPRGILDLDAVGSPYQLPLEYAAYAVPTVPGRVQGEAVTDLVQVEAVPDLVQGEAVQSVDLPLVDFQLACRETKSDLDEALSTYLAHQTDSNADYLRSCRASYMVACRDYVERMMGDNHVPQ